MTVLQFLGKDSYKISVRKMPRLTKNRLDHPQMLIDGILVDCVDATYWMILNGGRTKIPYSRECLEKKWKVIKIQ